MKRVLRLVAKRFTFYYSRLSNPWGHLILVIFNNITFICQQELNVFVSILKKKNSLKKSIKQENDNSTLSLSTAIWRMQAGVDLCRFQNFFILLYNSYRQLRLKWKLQAIFFCFVERFLWKHAAILPRTYDEIVHEKSENACFLVAAI